jgi:hypothetical protein
MGAENPYLSWIGSRTSRNFKRILRAGFRKLGFVVHRVSTHPRYSESSAPPLFDDVMDALYEMRAGNAAVFQCPVDACVFRNGMDASKTGWNPFSAATRELVGGHSTYEGSVLERYYAAWQPGDAREALFMRDYPEGPAILGELPPYALHTPWSGMSAPDWKLFVERAYKKELERAGKENATVDSGFLLHGPVSTRVGKVEHGRTVDTYQSIARNGYVRDRGVISVLVLRRNGELRFLVYTGHHRIGVAAALGIPRVPAIIRDGALLDVNELEHWPQVRLGVWSQQNAMDYFNHLFDFDSRSWARARGLLA